MQARTLEIDLYVFLSPTRQEDPPGVFFKLAQQLSGRKTPIFITPATEPQNIIARRIFRIFFSLYLLFMKLVCHRRIILYSFSPEPHWLFPYIPIDYAIYDCLDVFYPSQFDKNAQYIRNFDVVFAHNPLLLERIRKIHKMVILAPHGPYEKIVVPKQKPVKIPSSVVYAGGISNRIDYPLLLQIIQRLPTVTFYFISEQYLTKFYVCDKDIHNMSLWTEIRNQPNVRVTETHGDSSKYAQLSKYEVALLPYISKYIPDEYANQEVTPMKLWGYIANSLPIVSTDLSIMRFYAKHWPVYCASTPTRIASCIKLAMKTKVPIQKSRLEKIINSGRMDTKVDFVIRHVQTALA